MSGLIYIGNGTVIIGVPARDLTDADLTALPEGVTVELLIERGLYRKDDPAPKKSKTHITKDGE